MEKEIENKYIKAGKIAADVREKSKDIVLPGARMMDIAEKVEQLIRDGGGDPAFPVNISINDVAAHFTPTIGEQGVIKDSDVVKIDIGVHVDGYVADTAITVCLNKDYADMKKAAEHALHEAVKLVRPGVQLNEISRAIEDTIKNIGFKPISNLTGHGLNRYDLHTDPTIPNVYFEGDYELKENQVIAIEPFATDGAGYVKDSDNILIFSIFEPKPVRNPDARMIINMFEDRNGLPFAERWIKLNSLFKIRLALRELRERNILHDYHVLREAAGGMVTQAEHSIIVRDQPLVITE